MQHKDAVIYLTGSCILQASCGLYLKYCIASVIQSHMFTFCLSPLNMYCIGLGLWPWLGRERASFHLEIKRETASNYSMLITYSLSSSWKITQICPQCCCWVSFDGGGGAVLYLKNICQVLCLVNNPRFFTCFVYKCCSRFIVEGWVKK